MIDGSAGPILESKQHIRAYIFAKLLKGKFGFVAQLA